MRKATYENQNKTVNIYMLKMKNKMTETPNESLVIICPALRISVQFHVFHDILKLGQVNENGFILKETVFFIC